VELTDLFGPGATVAGGKLIIPRSSLELVGLDNTNNNAAAIMTAVFLLIRGYFEGELLDGDGSPLLDGDGVSLGYQNFRSDDDVALIPNGRRFSSDESVLYWRWLITFYEPTENTLLGE
jgi:hypothetical protein